MLLYKLSSARSVILLTAEAKTYDSPITAVLTTAGGFDTAVSSTTWIVVVSIAGVFMLALIFIGLYTYRRFGMLSYSNYKQRKWEYTVLTYYCFCLFIVLDHQEVLTCMKM